MKIGIVCNALANSGGMERYTLDIIRGFVSAGHELTVFTRKIDRSLYEATLVKTVKINASFLPKRLRDFYISNLLPGLRKKYPVDVMLGCCRSRHVDVVICGGTHPGFLKATGKKKSIFDRFVLPFEKASYQEAKYVVAHSRLVEGEIRTYYQIPVQRLFLIPPPVDLSIFKPQKDDVGGFRSCRRLIGKLIHCGTRTNGLNRIEGRLFSHSGFASALSEVGILSRLRGRSAGRCCGRSSALAGGEEAECHNGQQDKRQNHKHLGKSLTETEHIG